MMSWSRRSFKGQPVWVRVGADQRPVLDSEGRAEMKYRQEDSKSYRPSPSNLAPLAEEASQPAPRAEPRPRPVRAPRAASASSAHPRARSASSTDDHDPSTIHVWTDGACSGNPGPMGIGIVVVADRQRAEHGEYLGVGTNNIAELTAISRGLDLAAQLAPDRARPIRIYSDSSYALGLLGQGLEGQGQPRSGGQPARATSDLLPGEAGQGGGPRRRGQQRALRPTRPAGHHVATERLRLAVTGVAGDGVDESGCRSAVLLTVAGRAGVGRLGDVAGRRAVAAVATSALIRPVSRLHGVAAIVTAGGPAVGLCRSRDGPHQAGEHNRPEPAASRKALSV